MPASVEHVQVAEPRGSGVRLATPQPSPTPWPSSRPSPARDGNLVEPILAACRAEATLGEICEVLRTVWGTYTESSTF